MTNRRSFLKLLSAGAIGGAASSTLLLSQGCSQKTLLYPDEDVILSGGSYEDDDRMQHALIIINPLQKEKKSISTEFLPHGIITDPNNKYRILCFEKNGHRACEIDLQQRTVTESFNSENNQQFSGHGVFSFDGKQLYTIEIDTNNQQGNIAIRNGKTFALIKQLSTLGLNPHDCQLLPDNTLVISNTGQDETKFHHPSLVYINLQTEKLIQRKKLDDDSLNCGHFEISKNNDLVVASAPIDIKTITGGISIETTGQAMTTMKEPLEVIQRMHGEALSISINEAHQVIAVTHPQANLLSFWSLKDKKIIKAIGVENPRGIEQTLDNKNFIVSYGNSPALANITVKQLTPQVDSIIQATQTSGEHIFNWSRNLRAIMPKRVYD